jgi:hypothetical protein
MLSQIRRDVLASDLRRTPAFPQQRGACGAQPVPLGQQGLIARDLAIQGGELLIDIGDYATRRDAQLTSTSTITISHKNPPLGHASHSKT